MEHFITSDSLLDLLKIREIRITKKLLEITKYKAKSQGETMYTVWGKKEN